MSAVCEQQAPQIEQTAPSARPMKTPQVYYDVGRKDYWIQNTRDAWITVNETGLRRQMRECGYAAKAR